MQYYPPQQSYPVQPPYGPPAPPYRPYPQQAPPYQAYPPQQAMAPYQAPLHPQRPVMTPEQQKAHDYMRRLKRSANGVGLLLLIFLGAEIILSVVTALILYASGADMSGLLDEGSTLYLLETGLISTLIFFLAGLIFCLIKRVSFAELFPFQKVGGAALFKLSVIGLSFSLMSNYVVDMLDNTFSLFGVENRGGILETGGDPNVLMYFLTVAIMPALIEEFAFRGIVMGTLRPYSEGLAILVSSATFALMHGNFVQLPFTFCCGIVFAYIDIKTGSLLPSIIVHFLNNALSVLFDVLTAYGVVTNNGANMYYGIIFAVTGILTFIFLKRMIKKDSGDLFRLSGGSDTIPFKSKVKTAASSPTLIVFAVMMLVNCLLTMFPDVLSLS